MNEITITLTQLFTILGFAATVSGILGGMIRSLWKKVIQNTEAIAVSHQELSDHISAFKVEVANKYVAGEQLAEMKQEMLVSEERTLGAINNLTARIDRLLEVVRKDRL
jgi:hypothetical protein